MGDCPHLQRFCGSRDIDILFVDLGSTFEPPLLLFFIERYRMDLLHLIRLMPLILRVLWSPSSKPHGEQPCLKARQDYRREPCCALSAVCRLTGTAVMYNHSKPVCRGTVRAETWAGAIYGRLRFFLGSLCPSDRSALQSCAEERELGCSADHLHDM